MRLVNVWHIPPDKIAVFPNGVDVQRYRPYPEKRADLRASLGLDNHPMVIYVGSFYRWHDVATLLDGFAQVLPTYPDARLLLVGEGEQYQAMINHATNLGIAHAVIFSGRLPHDEIPNLVSAADIAVAPYPKMEHDWWGSSMKLFEYLASGVAVIASDIGEQVSEVIRNENNGLLVTPEDASEMGCAIKRLIGDPDLRERLGQRAREDAKSKYSWERYLSRLENVYEAVINHQSINFI